MRFWYWPLGLIVLIAGLAACEQSPPPTAVPLQPADSGVLLVEEFAVGSTGDWYTEADDLGMSAVLNERMLIEISTQHTIQYTTLQERSFSDFVMEVEVTQLAGSLESSFGILFRMQGPEQFYRFDITGNGHFTVERRNADGTWTRFVEDWPLASALKQGYNVTNLLRVAAEGSNIAVYANGEMLHEFGDTGYQEGTIALAGGTFGQPGLSVSFDNLVIQRP